MQKVFILCIIIIFFLSILKKMRSKQEILGIVIMEFAHCINNTTMKYPNLQSVLSSSGTSDIVLFLHNFAILSLEIGLGFVV